MSGPEWSPTDAAAAAASAPVADSGDAPVGSTEDLGAVGDGMLMPSPSESEDEDGSEMESTEAQTRYQLRSRRHDPEEDAVAMDEVDEEDDGDDATGGVESRDEGVGNDGEFLGGGA